ncbi:MAG: hypothetical protein V3W18_13830 [candidate division Zixibacteria bacterium]
MISSREPENLRRGKAFHRMIQAAWKREAEGTVASERAILKSSGRKGRVDIFVNDDLHDGVVAIVEIKASNWDRMTDKAVRRNVSRQIKQVWDYIESQIIKCEYVPTGEGKSVCPGIIFPQQPRDKVRQVWIENKFEEEGIVVVWHDEKK